jgi:hypothetical protein
MQREAVTIRIPADLLEQARQFREGSESFNEMVVEAISYAGAAGNRPRGATKAIIGRAHQRIVARSAEVEAATGIQPSSLDLIRQLRAGERRRD